MSGPVLHCPHCQVVIVMKQLPHEGMLASFRICPNCEGLFAPDPDTKVRQAICILLALISLVFTLLLYFESNSWLISAVSSYVVLGVLIYWGNKKMYLVPYIKKEGDIN